MVGRAFVLVVALASSARAGTLVRWTAPAACPSSDDVDARVAHRVGSDRDAPAIDVTVTSDSTGFVAQLGDARTLSSKSCDELADAVALIVARMVLEQPARAIAIATEPSAVVAVDVPSPPPPAPRSPAAWRAGLRAAGVSGIGAQPGVGVGGEVALPIGWRSWFVEPAGSLWARTKAEAVGGEVAVGLRTATLRVGYRGPIRAWLVTDLGELAGWGEQYQGSRGGAGTWLAVGAGASYAWSCCGPFALVVGGEVVDTVVHPTFALAIGDVLYEPARVAARLSLGVEASWP